MTQLSLVTSLYKSEIFLPRYLDSYRSVLRTLAIENYEFVFVLDGITDNAREFLLREQKQDPSIRIVELSRNFGHHPALMAGFSFAQGERVYVSDCDMEVEPQELARFWHAMNEHAYDVVYGYQDSRKGAFSERVGGMIFWKLFNALSSTRVPPNIATERLMTREYVEALLRLGDKNIFLAGLFHWLGFEQKGLPVKKGQREIASTYSFRKRLSLLIQALSSFTPLPLYGLFYIGTALASVSFLTALYFVAKKLMLGDQVAIGFSALVTVILFSLGATMGSLGVLGIYLSKIFTQVQNRPVFVVRKVFEGR